MSYMRKRATVRSSRPEDGIGLVASPVTNSHIRNRSSCLREETPHSESVGAQTAKYSLIDGFASLFQGLS